MFCPKCATQNIDGARFCRSCGADVSLVPMAMAGRLPEPAPNPNQALYTERGRRGRRRERRPPSYESAFYNLGLGIAFALISFFILRFTPAGQFWWYWMLIPAFTMSFKGIGQLARLRHERQTGLPASATPSPMMMPAQPQRPEIAPYNTSELMPPPPSVTEGTTRHLGQEGPTRVFEVRAELPKRDS